MTADDSTFERGRFEYQASAGSKYDMVGEWKRVDKAPCGATPASPTAGGGDRPTHPQCACVDAPVRLPATSVTAKSPQPIGDVAAGSYCWWWNGGAFRYANDPCWVVSAVNPGYEIVSGRGTVVSHMSGSSGCPATQAAAEAAFPDRAEQFSWTGGMLQFQVFDSNYGGNGSGSPSPSWKMCRVGN